jgi:hypothetical protein
MSQTKSFRALRPGTVSLLVGISVLALAPSVSRAAQFVLIDVTFTFTKADADNSKPDQSHYYVTGTAINPNRPIDWTAPVDYRNGTVHIRTEVIEKPAGSENTTWTLCYIPNQGKYGCINSTVYREKGVYEQDVPMMTPSWRNETLVWTAGIKQMDLVMKDGSGGHGFTHLRPDSEKFFPAKVRITMVQVSAGSTYDPSAVPNLPAKTSASGGVAADTWTRPSDARQADELAVLKKRTQQDK